MKKKLVVLLSLVLVMCSLFCACGNSSSSQGKNNSLIIGSWKYMPTDSVMSFDESGICKIDGTKYEYTVEDKEVSIISWGTLTIGTEDKWDVLQFSSGETVGVKENEYEEYYNAYKAKEIAKFYDNAIELKIGETYTLSDDTKVSITTVDVVGEDYPILRILMSVADNHTLNVENDTRVMNEEELISTDSRYSSSANLIQDEDGTYRLFLNIGADDFTQQTLEECPLCYQVFTLNGTDVYFNVKNVTIPADI